MSQQLREFVKSSLNIRNVSPEIISSVDVLIQRSVLRLQPELLPPRKWDFTCGTRKQEYRVDGELKYNFFYLPKDFRTLDEFKPLKSFPYRWVTNEYDLYNYEDINKLFRKCNKGFTIVDNNFEEDSKYEKILIANPFPEDDERIHIKYYVNAKDLNWEWIPTSYYEAIIADVEKMLGLTSFQEADDQLAKVVEQHKEHEGNLMRHGKATLNGSFFGKRLWGSDRRKLNKNN